MKEFDIDAKTDEDINAIMRLRSLVGATMKKHKAGHLSDIELEQYITENFFRIAIDHPIIERFDVRNAFKDRLQEKMGYRLNLGF